MLYLRDEAPKGGIYRTKEHSRELAQSASEEDCFLGVLCGLGGKADPMDKRTCPGKLAEVPVGT